MEISSPLLYVILRYITMSFSDSWEPSLAEIINLRKRVSCVSEDNLNQIRWSMSTGVLKHLLLSFFSKLTYIYSLNGEPGDI